MTDPLLICCGTVCSSIDDGTGNHKDLLNKYKDLMLSNFKDHANTTWVYTTGDNIILVETFIFTEDKQQRLIRSIIIAKWIRKWLYKPDQKILDLIKKILPIQEWGKKENWGRCPSDVEDNLCSNQSVNQGWGSKSN